MYHVKTASGRHKEDTVYARHAGEAARIALENFTERYAEPEMLGAGYFSANGLTVKVEEV